VQIAFCRLQFAVCSLQLAVALFHGCVDMRQPLKIGQWKWEWQGNANGNGNRNENQLFQLRIPIVRSV